MEDSTLGISSANTISINGASFFGAGVTAAGNFPVLLYYFFNTILLILFFKIIFFWSIKIIIVHTTNIIVCLY